MAIWILETTPETISKRVSLFIDNQSIITAVKMPKAKSGEYLLDTLRSATNRVACNLTMKWISSHSKVRGNEEVDKLVKEAAAGRGSAPDNLPHVLWRPLPASASATKQAILSSLKLKWSKRWDVSPRKPRIMQLGGSFPYIAFLKRVYLLMCKQSSMLLQIQCGHFPLNAYLHQISKSDTNKCQKCFDEEEATALREIINHFIFICPAYTEARNELIDNIRLDKFHLINIMSNINKMKALTTFINRTGRLWG